MNDVEERILSYPHLSVEEQREIETYVESNPEWASLLRDVRSVEGLSANLAADLPSNALLATYVLVQHLYPDNVPARLQAAFSELEARIERKEALRAEVETARLRLREAEAVIDPVSHFEALTEHDLDPEDGEEPEQAENDEPESGVARTIASFVEVFQSFPRLARGGAVVAIVLVGTYGGLYGVSHATQSTLDRLAAVTVSKQVIENYTGANMRGLVPESDAPSADKQYLEALSALREARVSTMGLFPRYDVEILAQAEQHLSQVLEQVEPGSFLALEAHFYLGKIALAQEEVGTARSHFKSVVKQEGRRVDESYEILKILQQEYGTEGE